MHYNTVTYVALGVAVILSIGGVVSTQDLHVLWDNENSSDYDNNWRYLMDTLRAHGVIVHYVEDTSYFHSEEGVGEGWTNLMAMDMLCLIDLCYYYDAEEKGRIINFARSGGRIVELESSSRFHPYANDLLINSGWRTTMEILDTVNRLLWSDEEAYELTPFPPVTNGFGICKLFRPTAMYCGEHAWPYYIIHGSIPYPVAAISYPFLHEGNCSTYILLVTGVENWNENRRYADECGRRFASNLVLTAAGVPGYELPPGAIPGGGFAPGCGEQADTTSECFAHPSPFTPNGDGVNDFAKFEYPGMHRNEGVLYIYTLENEFVRKLQNGEVFDSPKGTIYWDGKDAYGRLMQNGVYIYIIQDDGETKCRGTVYLAR